MAAPTEPKLVHQAFLYGSRDEFVAAMAPVIRAGLEEDDTVFAATTRANVDALREELGADRDLVELQDTTEWMTRPYERLQAFRRLVAEVPSGHTLRAMGEPVWAGSDAVVRQWARYESIINLALADAQMLFICLYDSAALPDHILGYAHRTHPTRVEDGSDVACTGFVPPERFSPDVSSAPPVTSAELPLPPAAFRHAVAEHALESGLAAERVDDFVLAAHEIAANALVHGRYPVSALMWEQAGELVCQVTDAGAGIADPLVGWLPPSVSDSGGWGLPIARQLADALEVAPEQDQTVVSVHMSLGSGR